MIGNARLQVLLGRLLSVLPGLCCGELPAEEPPRGIEQADGLFAEGRFGEAAELCGARLTEVEDDYPAVLRLGEIALLANRLDEAERRLSKARQLRPDEARPMALLAEAYYRRDNFQAAEPLFRQIGRTAMADKLASFKSLVPYQVASDLAESHLDFALTDPLPVVRVRVNHGEEVFFLIDTGGSELILDPAFAKQVGAERFGSETGTFAGGSTTSYEHGRVERVTLGAFEVRNVPVHLLDTTRLSRAAGGKPVKGILGTVLLYHFLPTIDYRRGRLELRRLTDHSSRPVEAASEADGRISVPFWLAGDHFIVARGSVNGGESCLMLVDTGLAGNAFTCPESTLERAGIELKGPSSEGVGGAGPVRVTPFLLKELSLGPAVRRHMPGVFGPFPASLEHGLGFRLGGLISHAFFRSYRVTFDFVRMSLNLEQARRGD